LRIGYSLAAAESGKTGRAVLAGRIDYLTLNPPERWVGGIRIIAGQPAWRSNAEEPPIALSPEENAAIATSKAAATRGEFAIDEQVRSVRAKHGI
jgi:hypothetical protein